MQWGDMDRPAEPSVSSWNYPVLPFFCIFSHSSDSQDKNNQPGEEKKKKHVTCHGAYGTEAQEEHILCRGDLPCDTSHLAALPPTPPTSTPPLLIASASICLS